MMSPRRSAQQRVISVTAIVLVIVAIVAVVFLSRALGKMSDADDKGTGNAPKAAMATNTTNPNAPIMNANTPANTSSEQPISSAKFAVIVTNMGNLPLELYPDSAPKTVQNFVTLSRRGYFDNLTFHRISKDFVIQGGDPNGNGTGGTSIFGATFQDEISDRKYQLGSLAMANRGPNTNSSQFFIVTTSEANKLAALQGGYTLFGQYEGDPNLLVTLNALPTDANEKPTLPLTIKTIVAADTMDEAKAAAAKVQ